MTTPKSLVLGALTSVLHNCWAVELPPAPTFPAAVFRIDSEPEDNWCAEGGYDQHSVDIFVLAKTLAQAEALRSQISAALEALPETMFEESRGDAPYEDDPNVFALTLSYKIRTRRYT